MRAAHRAFLQRLFPILAAATLTGCGDPATFRPAKGATAMPPVKTAFRIKVKPTECVSLGYIDADGANAIEEISETAARHGANNFFISYDGTDERELVRDGNRVLTRTNHKYIAEALRCPTSEDLPK